MLKKAPFLSSAHDVWIGNPPYLWFRLSPFLPHKGVWTFIVSCVPLWQVILSPYEHNTWLAELNIVRSAPSHKRFYFHANHNKYRCYYYASAERASGENLDQLRWLFAKNTSKLPIWNSLFWDAQGINVFHYFDNLETVSELTILRYFLEPIFIMGIHYRTHLM